MEAASFPSTAPDQSNWIDTHRRRWWDGDGGAILVGKRFDHFKAAGYRSNHALSSGGGIASLPNADIDH